MKFPSVSLVELSPSPIHSAPDSFNKVLAHELTKARLTVRQQIAIGVEYDGVTVGAFVAGDLVENPELAEIKAVKALDPEPRRSMPQLSSGDPSRRVLIDEFRQSSPGDQMPRSTASDPSPLVAVARLTSETGLERCYRLADL